MKKAKLSDINFDVLIPQVKYPFATYKDGFKEASYYLDSLEKFKTSQKPFNFKVVRTLPNGKMLFGTEMNVTLEDYKITEDAKNGFDIMVSVSLKQYRDYGTKKGTIINNKLTIENPRETNNSPAPKSTAKSYTTVKGDCLWNIAKKFYGDGSKYTKIYNANKDKIKNPNSISIGQKLNIPV
nr:LysM peptidoglycan-binding domain-containing protein [uncultured Anaerocolumna sp.]